MSRYIDIHTHRPTGQHIEPQAVGIHPWMAEKEVFEEAILNNAVAVGEIGLDFACDVNHNTQERVFRAQLTQAEQRNLPVILHCVRAFEPMMKILAEYRLRAVIFHGFIGSVQQAKRSIDAGYYLSFGPGAFRSPKTIAALQSTPENRLFAETDDSGEAIENIYMQIANVRNISVEKLQEITNENYNKIFNTQQ